jgi:anti-sigma factor RsiW
MTPEPTLQFDHAARANSGNTHLTEEQFGELLSASARGPALYRSLAEAHAQSCEQCAAELASLRECLLLFREASTAYADNELRYMPQVKLPARRRMFLPVIEPGYWVLAAAAIFLVALLPMQTLRQHTVPPAAAVAASISSAPAESDEALLEDVSREASASVPAAMQTLADPTDIVSSTSADVETSSQTSNQRKD